MKRRMSGMIMLVLSMVLLFGEAVQADFVTSGANTMYQFTNGTYATGVQKINGKLYYFNSAGILQKDGWIEDGKGSVYYANADGTLVCGQWLRLGKKQYYMTENGTRASGATKINGNIYFFSPSTGKLLTGKLKDESGKLYITDSKGVVYAGKFFRYKGKKYYANEDGSLATELNKVGSYYYFFKKKSGKMVTKSKKKINGYYYYFKKNGRAATDTWVKIKKKYYYFESDGRMATNKYIGNWYVGDDGVRVKASSAPEYGVVKKSGKYYCYDSNKNLVKNQWFKYDGDTYYAGADGAALIGLQTIGGVQYYFEDDGKLGEDTVAVVNGVTYLVDSKGRVTGTTSVNGNAIAKFAKKFVGNPYVYGGTSLTNGADCSGFCYAVYQKFGIQLMRVADDQMDGPSAAYQKLGYKKGYVVKDADLAPGDLVFYGSASYATHASIYIGDGKVVHACNTKLGIIISDIDYVHNRVNNKSMRYWA